MPKLCANYQDLTHACQHYDLTAFESALEHIPDINAQDSEGWTALGHVLMPDILSKNFFNEKKSPDIARDYTCKKNNFLISAVTDLLDKGALCANQPNLLFHIALAKNLSAITQKSLLETLIQAGADINAIGQRPFPITNIDIIGKTVIMAVLDLFPSHQPHTHDVEQLLKFLIQLDGIDLPENLLQICVENKIPIKCLGDLSTKSAIKSPENLAHAMTLLINNGQQNPSSKLKYMYDGSFFVSTLRDLCKLGAQLPEAEKTWIFHQSYHYRVYDLISLIDDHISPLINIKDPDNNYTAIDHVLFGPESRKNDPLGPSGCNLLTDLLNHGADLNIIDERNKRNILQYVIKSCESWPRQGFTLLQTILSKGILDINIEDDQRKGITPFATAAQQHWPHVEIVGALLAEPSLKLDPQSCTYWMYQLIDQDWRSVYAVEYYGSIPILAANDPKVLAIFQRLIALGAQINKPTTQGVTLLHKSCTKNPALFNYLLQQKNIHIPGDLLHHIISCKTILSPQQKIEGIIHILAKNPLSICQVHDGEIPLSVAINQFLPALTDYGRPIRQHDEAFEIVNTLLFADTKVHDFSPESENSISILASLIPLTVRHINQRGETTLHQVVRNKMDTQLENKLIATLIDKGADLDTQDSDKRIPLYYWCVQANAEENRYKSSLEQYDKDSFVNEFHTFNLLKSWQNIPIYLSLVWGKMTWGTEEHKNILNNQLPHLNTECIDNLLSYLSIKDFLVVMRGTQLAVADHLTQRAKQASQLMPTATLSEQVGKTSSSPETKATIGMTPL